MINILDKSTIDKIAAGEVVERPSSIAKELLENALDAGASSITIEIKDGGSSLIRITDNGSGMPATEVKKAFLRHATSKIAHADDLYSIRSLGFRGEALSSIAAVCRCELITKTKGALVGTRYVIEGGEEIIFEEVGSPEGTTIIAKDIFFNTPVRRKFLKSLSTETAHISDMIEKLALSHADVAFRFIVNNHTKLQTVGNGKVKDVIYQVFGKEITSSLAEVNFEKEGMYIKGYIGLPSITRASRNLENYYINGRYIKNKFISKALEEGYADRLMQHQYPFALLNFSLPPAFVDVNVHPTKMEVRFEDVPLIFTMTKEAIEDALKRHDDIRRVSFGKEEKVQSVKVDTDKEKIRQPEPFEVKRRELEGTVTNNALLCTLREYEENTYKKEMTRDIPKDVEASHFEQLKFLDKETRKKHCIIGQVFATYWIVELDKEIYFIDQHAAHEKVMYEKLLALSQKQEVTSQLLHPPLIISLSDIEGNAYFENEEVFKSIGFEVEHFGGKEYKINAIPAIFPSIPKEELFKELLSDSSTYGSMQGSKLILAKVASMSCKAAIKGNQRISLMEAEDLIDALLTLDNPYNCPHGRPTIIKMSQSDIEKKFKRIV